MKNIFTIYDDFFIKSKIQNISIFPIKSLDSKYVLFPINFLRIIDGRYSQQPPKSNFGKETYYYDEVRHAKEHIDKAITSVKECKNVDEIIALTLKTCSPFKYPLKIHYYTYGNNDNPIGNIFENEKFTHSMSEFLRTSIIYNKYGSENEEGIKRFLSQNKFLTSDKYDEIVSSLANNFSTRKNTNLGKPSSLYKHSEYILSYLLGEPISGKEIKVSSLGDLILLLGLVTSLPKSNPYNYILPRYLSKERTSSKFTQKKMGKFLNSFIIDGINLNEQLPEITDLSYYLIERISNVNLINHIHKQFSELPKSDYINNIMNAVKILALYPLVDYRLHIIDIVHDMLCKHEKRCQKYDLLSQVPGSTQSVLSNVPLEIIITIILYQSFFYIPLVSALFQYFMLMNPLHTENLVLSAEHNELHNLFANNTNCQTNTNHSTRSPKHRKPSCDNFYEEILSDISCICYESLTGKHLDFVDMTDLYISAMYDHFIYDHKSHLPHSHEHLPTTEYNLVWYVNNHFHNHNVDQMFITKILSNLKHHETIDSILEKIYTSRAAGLFPNPHDLYTLEYDE